MKINWILEREVFRDNHDRLAEAATKAGHKVISWDDFWWENGKYPSLENEPAIFHGSLGNASRIASDLSWMPGVFCNTLAFECRAWYESAKSWLLHEKWVFSTVSEFVSDPDRCLAEIGSPGSFFVRPDSPLKPFSGRVIERDKLSFEALDYGFYYEDKNLPIVITPVLDVGPEWRFVITGQEVIASSAYEVSDRTESNSDCPLEVVEYAQEVAMALIPPDPVYILDVCNVGGDIKLIEINPFSGADLYACDRQAIVSAVEEILMV
ncbi:MAG: ATP-grasp domain-containing protein [Desulfobacterales bacterium]|nr:ATP-grasp domain-containing protein [Desulfobacterales bacterium]